VLIFVVANVEGGRVARKKKERKKKERKKKERKKK
tara:strand:- start:117 stop:221 length:105 start_codon:yes stop_codon:yes gene_type:complete